jgi:gliding motility-associated-like protein
LFYTNGVTVWDRQNQPMTNACPTCDGNVSVLNGHISTAQGVLIVKRPGSSSLYYVFTTDSQENQLVGGFSYTEVDMSLRGGLGGVTAVRNVRLPTPTLTSQTTEGIAGLQHTNRRDVWVVAHGLNTDVFYSFLVTAAGISAVPVASSSGGATNRISNMKFAPDGKHMARCALGFSLVELFDFNASTGQVSNAQVLSAANNNYYVQDVEFSPDASKLYQVELIINNGRSSSLHQYDLQAGSMANIRNSKQLIGSFAEYVKLEIGPDGRIYSSPVPHLGIIDRPNRRGSAANFRPVGVWHPANLGSYRPFSFQNIVRLQPPALDYMAETACAGEAVRFEPYEIPVGTGPLTWTFYDPQTGITDSVQGSPVVRTYPTAGTYTITLSITSRGQYYRFQRNLVISPLPTVSLPDTVALCQGPVRLEIPTQPPGSTVQWSDGSTGTQLTATTTGKYWVQVRNIAGCVRTDTTVAIACQVPNIITPNGDAANETFRLVGIKPNDWNLEIYNRWGRLVYRKQGYDNSWNAHMQADGIYYYLLHNPQTGQQLKGWVEVAR